ncbi:MAG: hypothetical protein EP329_22340 [Deltaproteobacteria bacterium]|nr:MAG: hypothetical protein EP329_22340 [Deltaproteobacteria bacterium]
MNGRHLRWAAVAVGLAVAWSAPEPARAAADPDVLLGRPASDALLWRDTLLVLAPDHRGVVGLGPDGAPRWRVALAPPDDEGPFALVRLAGARPRVGAVIGDRVVVVDPATGEAGEPRETGRFAATSRPGCALEQRDGACAISCPCSFQLVSCEDLAPIGPRWALPGASRDPDDDPDSATCSGRRGALVGRVGDLLIASVPGPRKAKSTFFVPYAVVAVDRARGEVRWSSEALGRAWPTPELTGVAPDGASAWVGTADGRIAAFDPRNGDLRWSAEQQPGASAEAQAVYVPGDASDPASGLVVRAGERIQRRRLSDGHVVWTIHAPTERVLPRGWDGEVEVRRADAIRVVAPDNGAALASFALPKGSGRRQVFALERGWLVASSEGLRRIDEAGKEAARAKVAGTEWAVGESAVVIRGRDNLTVVDGQSLLPIYGLGDASYGVLAVEGALGRGVMAVLRHADRPFDKSDPKSFDEVRIIRFRHVGGR